MNKKDEQLVQFYTKYNAMSAEEQQLMEVGFIDILAPRVGFLAIVMATIGILIGHYLM